jgi:hypothetical protein
MAAPKLLDRMRATLRVRHYSIRTEDAYVHWAKRYILFHGKRHPSAMGPEEINQFLTHLAVERQVSGSTQSQALSAILFLYREVLGEEVPWIEDLVRAPRRERLPVVLTRDEVRVLRGRMSGVPQLVARLMYGTGEGGQGPNHDVRACLRERCARTWTRCGRCTVPKSRSFTRSRSGSRGRRSAPRWPQAAQECRELQREGRSVRPPLTIRRA